MDTGLQHWAKLEEVKVDKESIANSNTTTNSISNSDTNE
jgi:hypothetical protein